MTAILGGVMALGQLDHRRGDIDAGRLIERARQCLRDATDPAAEIERASARHAGEQPIEPEDEPLDLVASGLEEGVDVPFVALLVVAREDRPKRIFSAEMLPRAPETSELHER